MGRGGPLFLIESGQRASSLPWEVQLHGLCPTIENGEEKEGVVGTAPK